MNKQVVLAALMLTISSGKLLAQSPGAASKPVKTGDEWKMPGNAIKRSQDFADYLKRNLALDDEATKKVFQAYLANTKSVDEISVLPLSDKEKADKLKANQVKFNQTLKIILHPAQYEKYLKLAVKN